MVRAQLSILVHLGVQQFDRCHNFLNFGIFLQLFLFVQARPKLGKKRSRFDDSRLCSGASLHLFDEDIVLHGHLYRVLAYFLSIRPKPLLL